MIVFAVVYYGNYYGKTIGLFSSHEKAVKCIEERCGYDYAINDDSDYQIKLMEVK